MSTNNAILSHYKISNPFPDEWPAEKDDVDSSEDEDVSRLPPSIDRRSKSRYSALERNAGYRTSVPGAERTKDGRENLVQKDEPDPLGMGRSVMQVLQRRGLPVEDDQKLRKWQPHRIRARTSTDLNVQGIVSCCHLQLSLPLSSLAKFTTLQAPSRFFKAWISFRGPSNKSPRR